MLLSTRSMKHGSLLHSPEVSRPQVSCLLRVVTQAVSRAAQRCRVLLQVSPKLLTARVDMPDRTHRWHQHRVVWKWTDTSAVIGIATPITMMAITIAIDTDQGITITIDTDQRSANQIHTMSGVTTSSAATHQAHTSNGIAIAMGTTQGIRDRSRMTTPMITRTLTNRRVETGTAIVAGTAIGAMLVVVITLRGTVEISIGSMVGALEEAAPRAGQRILSRHRWTLAAGAFPLERRPDHGQMQHGDLLTQDL